MDNFLSLFDVIGELARKRYQAAERSFAVLGLNHTEARLLTLLDRESGIATQEVLSNLISVDRSNAGRALKNLEQAGLITRRKDEEDKRTNHVQLTAKGRDTLVDIARIRTEIAQNFFGDLSDNEAGSIVPLLRRALTSGDHV